MLCYGTTKVEGRFRVWEEGCPTHCIFLTPVLGCDCICTNVCSREFLLVAATWTGQTFRNHYIGSTYVYQYGYLDMHFLDENFSTFLAQLKCAYVYYHNPIQVRLIFRKRQCELCDNSLLATL